MLFKIFELIKYKLVRLIERNPKLNLLIYNNIRFFKFLLPHEKDFYGMLLLCKNQKKLVKLSEENLVLVQDQYSLGRSSILDVIDAQETYFTAETKYMTASYELLKFMYEFNRYNGGFDMFYVNTKSKIDNNLIDDIVNSIDNKLINKQGG